MTEEKESRSYFIWLYGQPPNLVIECASANWMPEIGPGLTLWQGSFQDVEAEWLRFVDSEGRLLLTGGEQVEQEREKAEEERTMADRLAQRLRELGEDVD